jgi:uncharacterized protein
MPAKIVDDTELSRFEIYDDAELAGYITYQLEPGSLALNHTQIVPEFQGRSFAGTLVRHVLRDASERGLAVLPHCPFIRQWLVEHPEFIGVVPEARRAEFGLDGV